MRSGTTNDERLEKTRNLNKSVRKAVLNFKPPEQLTVSDWSDKYRRLSAENSAEAGPWRTSRDTVPEGDHGCVHGSACASNCGCGIVPGRKNRNGNEHDGVHDRHRSGTYHVRSAYSGQCKRHLKAANCTDDSGHEASAEENCDVKKP